MLTDETRVVRWTGPLFAVFDVLTTPGVQRIESIALAVFVELPLASVCIWLSWHAQQLEERRIVC